MHLPIGSMMVFSSERIFIENIPNETFCFFNQKHYDLFSLFQGITEKRMLRTKGERNSIEYRTDSMIIKFNSVFISSHHRT